MLKDSLENVVALLAVLRFAAIYLPLDFQTPLLRNIEILKEAGVYVKTLIVFTSDHGMAFAGAKTTVYEPGLRVPFVVRNPYAKKRRK